jgi:redox-sensitive bicupin YhaK (pirin superfamily)
MVQLSPAFKMARPWQGVGPWIFGVFHVDKYPEGKPDMSPNASLAGRDIGMDMRNPSGWSMYHGDHIPGFPAHPHRGFETVSIVTNGYIDHADSTGAGARYGKGDTQWVTAGKGVSHSEMFPLVHTDKGNTLELYQLWLNLPAKSKLVPPEFVMFWDEKTPTVKKENTHGCAKAMIVAGKWDSTDPLPPPVNSYAADPNNDVAVWVIQLEPHATIKVPAKNFPETERAFYVHHNQGMNPDPNVKVNIGGQWLESGEGVRQEDMERVTVTNGPKPARVMVMQGKPINEPIAQRGPFVMNTQAELQQAFADYQRTQFGGWQWDSQQPVYPRDRARFADHGNGKVEYPGGKDASPQSQ